MFTLMRVHPSMNESGAEILILFHILPKERNTSQEIVFNILLEFPNIVFDI